MDVAADPESSPANVKGERFETTVRIVRSLALSQLVSLVEGQLFSRRQYIAYFEYRANAALTVLDLT